MILHQLYCAMVSIKPVEDQHVSIVIVTMIAFSTYQLLSSASQSC